MSDYAKYQSEKEQIDFLLDKGFVISKVTENLNGSHVEFTLNQETESLQITTANARKYFSSLLYKDKSEHHK